VHRDGVRAIEHARPVAAGVADLGSRSTERRQQAPERAVVQHAVVLRVGDEQVVGASSIATPAASE